jgi:hypothetical protein
LRMFASLFGHAGANADPQIAEVPHVMDGYRVVRVFAATPAIAHALELPGKMRLAQHDYLVVQRVYYPGFTDAGIAEPSAIVAAAILPFSTPVGEAAFALRLVALAVS